MEDLKLTTPAHPRIHLTAGDIPLLKERAPGTHRFYYSRLLEAADEFSARRLPGALGRGDDDRGFGDMLTVMAMALVITEDEKYLRQVRRFLKPMLAAEDWQGGIGLVTGHLMSAVAICYDWLQEYLKPSEIDRIRERIIHHARMTYRLASTQRVWWHDMFLQNWCQVPTATLAYAAAALAVETREADAWIAHADFVFATAREALAADGSCEEGQSYMTYSWEWFLRYFDVARGVFGRDHFDCDWLRNAPYAIIHATLPDPHYHNSAMIFGDGRRHCEWNGPVCLLQKSAAEYRDEAVQGFASWLASRGVGVAGGDSWLNMLWYDPGVPEGDFRRLPTERLFGELGMMYARSGWGEDAVLVGFKCTSNTTDYVREAFPGRPISGGHNHPDAASFQVYAFGEWLAVDPGYTLLKRTENHNTVMVNNTGQLGGDKMWFDTRETMGLTGVKITDFVSTDEYVYARADASKIYKPKARLARFIRHFLYLKPYDLVIIDELESKVKSKFEWLIHAEEEISADGNIFSFAKNGVTTRIVCLAPEDFSARIRRQKVAAPKENSHEGVHEMYGLWVSPAEKTRRTVFVTLVNFYTADAPGTDAELEGIEGGTVSLRVRRKGAAAVLRLDMDKPEITLQ